FIMMDAIKITSPRHQPARKFSRGRNAGHPAPPAQIRTCATNASGSCFESTAPALIRVWMYDPHGGYPALDMLCHVYPTYRPFVSTPSQRFAPVPTDFRAEGLQRYTIARHTVVVDQSCQDFSQPTPLIVYVNHQVPP